MARKRAIDECVGDAEIMARVEDGGERGVVQAADTGWGVVDCEGTSVRGNVINTEADPDHVKLGMKLKLATQLVGTDDDGTEAIGFGFEPLEA